MTSAQHKQLREEVKQLREEVKQLREEVVAMIRAVSHDIDW